jgi:3alpha(or 20beta)-hydroxysteroid dehydrogenase
MNMQGKVVMVTGAARGIGQRCATELASRGALVFATDLNAEGAQRTAAEIERAGGKAFGRGHDVTAESEWNDAIAFIKANAGRLDALVNNAGVMVTKPFKQTSLEEFRRQQVINVESVWLGCQAAHDLLVNTASEYGGASIVNLSSTLGLKGGPMHTAYCASKGAVRLLSKALAVELGKRQVRVNSVHPGLVDTDLGMGAMKDLLANGGVAAESLEAVLTSLAARIPLGRYAQTDDVARLIAFLCSDDSRFMSGGEFVVDGGGMAA